MAITMNYKPTAFATIFDANKIDFDKLDALGVKVIVAKDHFDVVGPGGEDIVMHVGLNEGVVGIAKAGGLPNVAKAPVAAAIKAAFNHALKTNNWQVTVGDSDVTDETDIQLSADDMDGDVPVFEEVQKVATNKHGGTMTSTTEAKQPAPVDGASLPKVKLKDATALYQPVDGTSSTSIYICVGTAGALKFAARRKNESLSIRVEGPVAAHKDALVAAGFNEEYIAKGYTSVHFHGIDLLMQQRALGAVLMGTGLAFETPMPDIKKIGGE